MNDNPIRRGQLIAPFGVGAMVVDKRGTAMVTAALDYWYRRETGGDPSDEALDEFQVKEWRLERRLGVSHFRLPPDWRETRSGQPVPNAFLTVPFLKFPTWYSCRKCGRMERSKPTERQVPECVTCKERKWKGRMVQVPIVAVCRAGHLMEFPWREWVHASLNPSCQAPLRLVSRGGATLAAKWVECTDPSCKARRNLSGVTSGNGTETTVTNRLTRDDSLFLCAGERAWVGTELERKACGMPVQGSLRSALNVYYADVQSAIFLPIGSGSVPEPLIVEIQETVASLIGVLNDLGLGEDVVRTRIVEQLIKKNPLLETRYGRDVLDKAVQHILDPASENGGVDEQFDDETVFRHEEALALASNRVGQDLLTRVQPLESYGRIAPLLGGITLAEKIKETRVLNGFTRVDAPTNTDVQSLQSLMWVNPPSPERRWLPAQVVYGEGIYLSLNEQRLQAWETCPTVQNRVKKLAERDPKATARMVLLHTLSHLLMNQLTFSCGYSSATLRERLYASDEEPTRMAGLLIYTAEGDADGTLGGLVRMGKAENFVGMFEQAIIGASWCSADPVCMEAGDHGGQGPGSMNLAACHNCALVPETACEAFNRLLDRGLVVGTAEHPEMGFFAELLI